MKKNYSILILFIFFSLHIFAQEKRQLYIFAYMGNLIFEKKKVYLALLKDIMVEEITKSTHNIQLLDNSQINSQESLKKISNFVFSHGGDGFFYIDAKENSKQIIVIASLYSGGGDLVEQVKSNFSGLSDFSNFSEETKKKWLEIVKKLINKTTLLKTKAKGNIRRVYKFDHNFPLINFGVTTISGKFYFDRRDDNKLFSLFPIDVNLTLFPLKYFEIGAFVNFDKDNMIYKYSENGTDKFYYSNFIFKYGLLFGLSFFSQKAHFSLGLRIYNLFYLLADGSEWKKTDDYRSFFIPQFSIYLKLDFPILKFLYFSVFINFKTAPKFILENNLFFSNPFAYDFFVLEFSFIGLSIIL